MKVTAWRKALVAGVCGLLLNACGGGEGSRPAVSVTASHSSLQFHGLLHNGLPGETVTFSMRGGEPGMYYGAAVTDGPVEFNANFMPTSDTTATVGLSPRITRGTQATGNIRFLLCRDPACAQVVWSQTMPYTLKVFEVTASGLTLDNFGPFPSNTNLAISGHEGTLSTTRLTLTPPDTTGMLRLVTPRDTYPSAWLSSTRDTNGDFIVQASGTGLARGNHMAFMELSFADIRHSIARLSIPVTFTVGDGITAPADRTLQLHRAATGATLGGSAAIAFQGTQAPAWRATSDQPWLVLTQASGTGPGTLSYTVDTAQAAAIENWGSSTATVRVSADGVSDVSFNVTLEKRLPEVLSVSPNPLTAGRASTLRVIGRGLQQLAGGHQIRVGNATGIAGSILSDTEALITVPALAAGRTTVSIDNAAGLPAAQANLDVIMPIVFSPAAVTTTGAKGAALFDPVRQALYVVNLDRNTLQRFRLSNGQWQVHNLSVAEIGDIGFAPDRSMLYVGSQHRTLLAVDPDTLQVVRSHNVPTDGFDPYPLASNRRPQGFAVTGDHRLWFSSSQWTEAQFFDMRTRQFGTRRNLDPAQPSRALLGPVFTASADGSKLLITENLLTTPPDALLYATATGAAVAHPEVPDHMFSTHLSADGGRLLANHRSLYDLQSAMPIGEMLPTVAPDVFNSALSPNGAIGYALAGSYSNLRVDQVEVFDLNRVRTEPAQTFESIGRIPLTQPAFTCNPVGSGYCSMAGTFVLSPLGNVLLWVGDGALVVIPVPPAMAQAAGSPTRLRAAAR